MTEPFNIDADLANADWPKQTKDTWKAIQERIKAADALGDAVGETPDDDAVPDTFKGSGDVLQAAVDARRRRHRRRRARLAYSEDQERDASGKFGQGGGGANLKAGSGKVGGKEKSESVGGVKNPARDEAARLAQVEADLHEAFPNATITLPDEAKDAYGNVREAIVASAEGVAEAALELSQDYPDVAASIEGVNVGPASLPNDALGNTWAPVKTEDPVSGTQVHGAQVNIDTRGTAERSLGGPGPSSIVTPAGSDPHDAGRGVFTHEFGHVLDFQSSGQVNYAYQDPPASLGGSGFMEASRSGEGAQWGGGERSFPHISAYSMANSREYFAEAFTAARSGFSDRLTDGDRAMLEGAGVTIQGAAPDEAPTEFDADGRPLLSSDDFVGSIVWESAARAAAADDVPTDDEVDAAVAFMDHQEALGPARTAITKLTRLRAQLGTRLLAMGEQAYEAALRQAGVRVKQRGRSRLSAARSVQVLEAVDRREPLLAWLGAVGIGELEMLRGSFDTFHAQALDEFDRYWQRVDTVTDRLGVDSVVQPGASEAVDYLVAGWTAMARRRLLIGDDAMLASMSARLAAPSRGFERPAMTPDMLSAAGARLTRLALRINEGAATVQWGSTPDEPPHALDNGAPMLEAAVAQAVGLVVGVATPPRRGARQAAARKPAVKKVTPITLDTFESKATSFKELALRSETSLGIFSPESNEARRRRREKIAAMTAKQKSNIVKKVETLKAEAAEKAAGGAQAVQRAVQAIRERAQQDVVYRPSMADYEAEVEKVGLWEWQHGFYGEPKSPFDAHEALDGIKTPYDDDDRLTNNESWPDEEFYFPDDHEGCTCEWVLVT